MLNGFDLVIIVPLINFTDLFKLKSKVLKIHGITEIELDVHEPYRRWPLNAFISLLDKM